MANYKPLGVPFDRTFRNDLNENFKTLSEDFDNAVDTVSTKAYEQVVGRAKIEWLAPVNTFAELATTYPDAAEGKTVMTRDSGKVYRFDGSDWQEIHDIDPTAINEVDNRLTSQLAQFAHQVKSNGVGDSDNINAKIDLISTNGKGTLLLPDKEYVIDKQINYKPNVKIIAQKGSLLKKKSGLVGAVFKSSNIDGVNLENIAIDGLDRETTGVSITGGKGHKLKGLEVFNCSYGIFIDDSSEYEVTNSKVHDCTYYGITASATSIDCSNLTIKDNEVFNCKNSDVAGASVDGIGINIRGNGENETKHYLKNFLVAGNNVYNNGRAGITTIAAKDFVISDNISKGHTLNNSLGAGIIVSAASSQGIIKGNVCNENYNGITVDIATSISGESALFGNLLVTDNITIDNVNSGIRNHNAPKINITKNDIKNGKTGIFLNQYGQLSVIGENRIEGFSNHGIIFAGITPPDSEAQSDIVVSNNFIKNCGTDTTDATRAGVYLYQYKKVKLINNTFLNNGVDLRTHATDSFVELINNLFTSSLVIPSASSIVKWEDRFRDSITSFSSLDFNSDGKNSITLPDNFTLPHFGWSYVPLNTAANRVSSTTTAISNGYTGQKIYLLNINVSTITIKHNANTKNIGATDVVLSRGQAVEYTYRFGWIQTSAVFTTGL